MRTRDVDAKVDISVAESLQTSVENKIYTEDRFQVF